MAVSSTTGGLKTGVCLSTDRPDNPYTGQVIFESDTGKVYVWAGSSWVNIGDTSGEGVQLPSGTTAERPASPTTGQMRFNTTIGSAEYYDGSKWRVIANATPVWTTDSGTLATIYAGDTVSGTTIQAVATDPDGDTITYAILSGSLPTGLTLNTSTGAITGTESGTESYASEGVTKSFILSASDGVDITSRSFNIIKKWYDGSSSSAAATNASQLNDLGLSSGDYWFNIGGETYQAYYYSGEGGGWNLLASFSNVPGAFDYWCNGGTSSNTYSTSENIIGQTTKVGTLTGLSQSNAKAPAFWSLSYTSLLFYTRYNGNYGYERYDVTHSSLQWAMLNSTTSASRASFSSAQVPFDTGNIWFRNSITNDGAFIATSTVSNEASGGIIANVDGHYGYPWSGNVTRNASRTYNSDGTTTDNTVWVFGR